MVGAGLAIGIPIVLLSTGLLSPLLYQVKPNDAPTLFSVKVLLVAVAILARFPHSGPHASIRWSR
jgi:hypothetical protein